MTRQMISAELEQLEAELAASAAAGELEAVATRAISEYGPGVLGYLTAVLRDESDAGEAFSHACESLWRYLPRFRWESSMRTWFYALARSAIGRLRRDPHRRRAMPLSAVSEIVAQVRTATAPFRRTGARDGVRRLREQLDEDEQTLLVMRLDRQMAWEDVACVLSDVEEPTADDIKKDAARLRKRYQRLKERLKEMAQREGLLPSQ